MSPLHRILLPVLNALIRMAALLVRPIVFLRRAFQLIRLRYFWLKPRPGDIYVATFPKSGTTWVQMIMFQLATGGRGEFDHIQQVSPYYERLLMLPGAEALLDALPSPRIIKTHLPWSNLRLPRDARCIFVTRNPYDTFVSAYHHSCLQEGLNLPFERQMRAMVRGTTVFGRWDQYMRSWWSHRKDPNVLHVRYEDLRHDLEGQLRRIAAFCDIPIDESRMGDILEKCSFAYMKQHSDKFDPRLSFFDRTPPRTSGFIREGRSGVNEGHPELRAELEAELEGQQRKLGISGAEL
jgi:hypothetical protein